MAKTESNIGDLSIQLNSEVYKGEKLDTQVLAWSGYICTISGSDIEQFIKEMNDVIAKYRI